MHRTIRRRLLPLVCAATLVPTAVVAHTAPALADDAAFVVRSTAHTAPVADAAGDVWQARSTTLGTTNLSSRLVGQDVRGTTNDELYRRNAWNVKGYSTPVPTAGRYRVRLLLAEDFYWKAGQRVFGVTAEGRPAANDIDIVAAVGKGAAYDVVFDVAVDDGRLDLAFTKKIENPLVSAIEVRRLERSTDSATFDVRATASDTTLTHGGATWYPSDAWVGPARRSSALAGRPIGSTDDDPIYRPQVSGMTGWRTDVPEKGTYTVQLFLTESTHNAIGRRVFDVTAEGRLVLGGVDPFKAVGVRTAYAPRFDVEVDDGVLDLGFVNRVDLAAVSAIRVTRAGDTTPVVPTPAPTTSSPTTTTGETAPHGASGATDDVTQEPAAIFTSRMVARPTPVTDSTGVTWNRWSPGLGSWRRGTHLASRTVGGTNTPELYRENVWGASRYALAVSDQPAAYRVRLLMAEDYFTKAGQRVFDVKAEGEPVATGVDIAGAVGPGRAHDVTFETTVTDGMLSLDFVKRVDQPLVSAIEVTSTVPVTPPSSAPRRIVPVAPTSFWTMDVSNAPLAPSSAATVSALASDVRTRYGGIAGFNAYNYAVGYHLAGKDDAYVTVDRSCGGSTWTPGVYDGPAHFLDVPVPAAAVPAVGSDAHMTIHDPRTDRLWSFWQMRKNPETGRWSACWGGRIDDLSKSEGVFPSGYGAAASGLAMAPGMVTQDEVRRGRIDHAIAIVVPNARKGVFSWPANRTDGVSSDENAVLQGQRLRLAASVDLDRYDLTPLGRMIAEAAKKYGVVPVDTGGAVAVLAQAGDLEQAVGGTNPWSGLIGDRHWEVMRDFPWEHMEALPKDYGRP